MRNRPIFAAAALLRCPGCHCHQYEIGPTHDQVSAWRAEVGELVQELGH